MKTIEELEKDLKHYEKCLENWSHCIDEFIILEIENIQNKINFLLNRHLFEKKVY
jgi:hypothetical protein